MSYIVTAPLVIIPNADLTSGDGYFYEGALVPGDWNSARCKELAKEGMVAKAPKPLEPAPEGPASGTVEAILAEVGQDAAKATTALETEKAGKNRTSLVSKLEAIIAAATPPADQGD